MSLSLIRFYCLIWIDSSKLGKSMNGLSWKIRKVNVIKNMLVRLAAKYDVLYSAESPTFVMFLG